VAAVVGRKEVDTTVTVVISGPEIEDATAPEIVRLEAGRGRKLRCVSPRERADAE
jgi:hypothetical protein